MFCQTHPFRLYRNRLLALLQHEYFESLVRGACPG
jgi:hypothetical protein